MSTVTITHNALDGSVTYSIDGERVSEKEGLAAIEKARRRAEIIEAFRERARSKTINVPVRKKIYVDIEPPKLSKKTVMTIPMDLAESILNSLGLDASDVGEVRIKGSGNKETAVVEADHRPPLPNGDIVDGKLYTKALK